MKKFFSLLLVLAMVLCLCSCGTSPEKTIAGKWICTEGPESFSMELKANGTGRFFIDSESTDVTWEFIGEQTYENTETNKDITVYSYRLNMEDSYAMVTQAGGKEPLMLKIDDYTLMFEKK